MGRVTSWEDASVMQATLEASATAVQTATMAFLTAGVSEFNKRGDRDTPSNIYFSFFLLSISEYLSHLAIPHKSELSSRSRLT